MQITEHRDITLLRKYQTMERKNGENTVEFRKRMNKNYSGEHQQSVIFETCIFLVPKIWMSEIYNVMGI